MMTNANDLMDKLIDFSDDDSMNGFLDVIESGRLVKSVDLLAANPDIRGRVRPDGDYILNVKALEYRGLSFYAVEIEDDSIGELSEDWITSTYYVTEDFSVAERVLDERIMEWRDRWRF